MIVDPKREFLASQSSGGRRAAAPLPLLSARRRPGGGGNVLPRAVGWKAVTALPCAAHCMACGAAAARRQQRCPRSSQRPPLAARGAATTQGGGRKAAALLPLLAALWRPVGCGTLPLLLVARRRWKAAAARFPALPGARLRPEGCGAASASAPLGASAATTRQRCS